MSRCPPRLRGSFPPPVDAPPRKRSQIGVPLSYDARRPDRNLWEQSYVPKLIRGLGVTLRHFFRNVIGRRDTVTLQYPEERRAYPPRFRGVHRLTQRPDGSPRCTACFCCQTACPAECIHIVAGEYPEDHPSAPFEKYPAEFTIDELRCVFGNPRDLSPRQPIRA